jgi:hypothetical protein
MKVVDDEHRLRREQREERAQESPRERSQLGRVLGAEARQRRERLRLRVHDVGCGDRQVMEERSGIGVSGVGLEPDTGRFARLDVARDQRRLAGAGGTGDPDDRMLARSVEPREQPLSPQHVVKAWPAELRERDRRRRGRGPRHRGAFRATDCS